MRWLSASILVLALGCGNSSGVSPDGNGGGGGDDGGGGSGGNTPHTVTLTLTNRPNNAGMFSFVVAYQDGSAPWQLAPAPSGDTYTFPINAPSYGVAYTCIGASAGTATQVRSVTSAYFALGERTEVTLDVPPRCSDRGASGISLMGSVSNRPSFGTLVVAWGKRTAFVGSQSGNFQLQAQPGTHDLFVMHAVPEGNGDFYTDQVWVQRDVALSSNTTKMIDFADAQSTQQYGIDVSSVDPSARVNATTTLYTSNGTQGGLVREGSNWETQSLADADMRDSDVYDQSISVTVVGHSATVTDATNMPTDQTWDPPAPLAMPQGSVATKMPYITLQSTWPAYANVAGYTWSATQQLTGSQCGGNMSTCVINWTAMLSPGVSGEMPGYVMPDLASLTGWKAGLEFVAGTGILGSVTAYTSSAGASDFPVGIPANGTHRTFVRSDYVVTP